MNIKKQNRIAFVVLVIAVAAALAFALAGCQSPTQGAGVVASVHVGEPGEKPAALVRFDGNTFVAWGSQAYVGEAFVQATGLPVYIYAGMASTAVVKVAKPGYSWQGAVGDMLPAQAQSMFRASEIQAWGLTFHAPTVQ